MTKEARQELRELWAERVQDFLASGLSQRAWCREQGLRPNQLGYWLRKLEAETKPAQSGRWVRLYSVGHSGSGVVLRIGTVVLEIQRGFDQEVLVDVIRSLIGIC